jgi:hypothetical protein
MPTTFEIFPAIGIARVGASQEFFIGPEPDMPLDLRRRDVSHNLLRQAARFRIYQCDRDATGKLVAAVEVTAATAAIEWGVHLVNRKAAAKKFLDGGSRRNDASGDDGTDRDLIIDPGIKTIGNGKAPVMLDGGKFKGTPVPLGRLEIQGDGRLLVIGGEGRSRSDDGSPLPDDANFADNDHWHDDVADGPVTATITIGGNSQEAKGAWVVVAPPDFAPEIQNVVTLYDTLFALAVEREVLKAPATIFFDRHVRPILERAMSMQWVNRQARLGYDVVKDGQLVPAAGPGGHAHGGPGAGDFSKNLGFLGNPASPNASRLAIFRLLRDPKNVEDNTVPAFPIPPPVARLKRMPRLNDSAFDGNVLPLTSQQYGAMKLWSQGMFQTTDPTGGPPELIPDALTRVALEACTGGGFFPGIEAGRIMTEKNRYMAGEAFRLSHGAVKPGEITAQNALPWQADFFDCAWDSEKQLAWWPAQRPDDVLATATAVPIPWARGVNRFQDMIDHWDRLGFVKADPGNPGVFIETDRTL